MCSHQEHPVEVFCCMNYAVRQQNLQNLGFGIFLITQDRSTLLPLVITILKIRANTSEGPGITRSRIILRLSFY